MVTMMVVCVDRCNILDELTMIVIMIVFVFVVVIVVVVVS
jgi:hypothetical protein